MRRYAEIDFLRVFAAFVVLFFHYGFRGFAANDKSPIEFVEIAPFAKYGYIGVFLFFVISGFVILISVENSDIRRFFVSRVKRLYPSYVFCCTTTFLVCHLWGGEKFYVSIRDYFINLTMLSGFVKVPYVDGVYWSLTVELKFYFLVAFVVYFGWLKKLDILVFIWLVVSFFSEVFGIKFLRFFLVTEWAAFFSGGVVCYLSSINGWTKKNLFLFVFAICLGVFVAINQIDGFLLHYSEALSPVLVAGLVVSSFLVVAASATFPGFIFFNADLRAVGLLTYPLYLLHQNIGYVLMNGLYPVYHPYAILFFVTVLVLISSIFVVFCIEAPFLRFLKKFGI